VKVDGCCFKAWLPVSFIVCRSGYLLQITESSCGTNAGNKE